MTWKGRFSRVIPVAVNFYSSGDEVLEIYADKQMDADHVAAWSKGGATDAANCQMLCRTHNRAKGNR